METDEKIYLRYIESDDDVDLEALLVRHREGLFLFLLGYVHSEEDAEDLLMNTFVKLAVDRPAFAPERPGSFKSWLYTIARRTALSRLRKRRVETVPLDENTASVFPVKFVNYDGSELKTVYVTEGKTPVYSGPTPTKPADAQYTYTFAGWSPEIAAVTGEATYTATYAATPIAVSTYTITFDANGGAVNGQATATATTGTDGKLTSLPDASNTDSNMQFLGWFTTETSCAGIENCVFVGE